MRKLLLIGTVVLLIAVIMTSAESKSGFQKTVDGVLIPISKGTLRLSVYGTNAIRVTFAPGAVIPGIDSLAVIAKADKSGYKVNETATKVVLNVAKVRAEVDKATGAVSFFSGGNLLCRESLDGRTLTPAVVSGENVLSVEQRFTVADNEAFYGVGQDKSGLANRAGKVIPLKQGCEDKIVPVLVSSRGYGIFWDNPSYGKVDLSKVKSNLPTSKTGSSLGKPVDISFTAEVANAIDYYLLAGPKSDDVIAAYRYLTGDAPMFGKWANGYWQCKERYLSSNDLLEVADGFRSRRIPIDNIIQDWLYWPGAWGSHEFDKARYPDPAGLIKTLHEKYKLHVMISVWPKFGRSSPNYEEMNKAGYLLPRGMQLPEANEQHYDAFDPKARALYWRQLNNELFSLGIDGWWLDGDEPENGPAVMESNGIDYGLAGALHTWKTAMGLGSGVLNAFPLMHTKGVYEGQRSVTDQKRVFLLSRCSYAGMQRNAAACWSGDVPKDWGTLRNQIPAGLNFVMSGIPYWNTDIGGFWGGVDNGDPEKPGYRELFIRWLQFGTFCPMMRVHGMHPSKEPWRFGPESESIITRYINLRYRLLPYIYSTAWMITHDHYTMMRPLVMDFSNDANVTNIPDQFMFGPAMMINPVDEKDATKRTVYLPKGTHWIDFWTGQSQAGGQSVTAPAPIETLPIYVRAGSIIPMGPFIQYSNEKPADPIELRIYPGADGKFVLYEDEGDTYNYEKGKYSTILLRWNDKARELTIGKREGSFRGMLGQRKMNVVLVTPKGGVGIDETQRVKSIKYSGKLFKVKLGG